MSRNAVRLEENCPRIVKMYDGNKDDSIFVLVPGLGAEVKTLALVGIELEAQGKSYVLIEPPGFGQRNPRSPGVLLEGAAALTHAVKILPANRRMIYVGHSAGAMEALELASRDRNAVGFVGINSIMDELSTVINRPLLNWWRHPVKALYMAILINYIAGWLPEFMLRRLETPGHWLTGLFRPLVAQPAKLSREALHSLVRHNRCHSGFKLLRANRHYDYQGSAKLLKVPALLIEGSNDPLTTPSDKSEFVRGCQRKNRVTIVTMNTGHCTPVEAPQLVADELVKFSANLH